MSFSFTVEGLAAELESRWIDVPLASTSFFFFEGLASTSFLHVKGNNWKLGQKIKNKIHGTSFFWWKEYHLCATVKIKKSGKIINRDALIKFKMKKFFFWRKNEKVLVILEINLLHYQKKRD